MNIGQAIRILRKRKAIKQIHFAESIGITQSHLSQIEHGHKKPSMELLERIADGYKIPLAVILWYGLQIEDVPKEKQQIFELLNPIIDNLISEIF